MEPFTVESLWTAWTFEPLAVVVVVTVGALYLWGVLRLRGRGDAWSSARVAAFIVGGLGSALIATTSALAVYDTVLLSAHMVQHMVLSMVTPLFLALGAPVTLALRTMPAGLRQWLLALLHSRAARVLTFPPLAFALFVLSPWVLYFSGWYDATLRSDLLHELLHVHFVVVGSLFFWPLIGPDPVPGRVAYPFRLLMVFATLPFHAFLGITVMGSTTVIAATWYEGLGLEWTTPESDQELAGAILWGSGDLLALIVFAVLFVQWVRDSQREAARTDRRLDRLEAIEARSAVTHSGDSQR